MSRSAAISGSGSGVGLLISAFSGLRRFGLRALFPLPFPLPARLYRGAGLTASTRPLFCRSPPPPYPRARAFTSLQSPQQKAEHRRLLPESPHSGNIGNCRGKCNLLSRDHHRPWIGVAPPLPPATGRLLCLHSLAPKKSKFTRCAISVVLPHPPA
jgi:hypothetical protein